MEWEMSKYMRLGIVGALALLAVVVVSVATAASPREIYADYADNGRLDRTYSRSDLRSALNDAAIQGYGKPTVVGGLRGEIQEELGEGGVAGATAGSGGVDAVGRSGGTLPFTGVDLALLTAGAGFLVLFGWALRRSARAGVEPTE
jgi:hypothetical protein